MKEPNAFRLSKKKIKMIDQTILLVKINNTVFIRAR